ncbi:phosphate ABC transporter membrane protein 2, PhoT family [Salinihabitans flavidus]|uniref:Phosphate transport system permease protein PstA n=1 Tax=Salinihabitans flavidus TaxID=569882 RepID=A0A1H8VQ05_9RHOB|nr:phosphate ABC transporter permease PstA [Salinihabitans flavidus]SEP17373.1 phosphate ABC transporter membrane protein 2, PhoT family [Salinihabitans flavidus]
MTDSTAARFDKASPEIKAHLRKRKRSQFMLKTLGIGAISIAFAMLFLLVGSLISTGYQAFTQTHLVVEARIDPALVDPDNPSDGNFRQLALDIVSNRVIGGADTDNTDRLTDILSNRAQFTLRDIVVANPDLVGETVELKLPVADKYDQLHKGMLDRDTPEENRRLSDREIEIFDQLVEGGYVAKPLNWALLTNADSRFPEVAGLKGAIIGSAYALLVCFLLSFPVGIGAAIYLEEFAPKNRISDLIEININNLAAVPSVVFGLLGLAVFIGWFGMPRSVPFVGGMTLALMTLPTIIIATRAAIKAVPPSIREAALGVGASKQQVVFGHVLPLAMPGILTGTIIGMAQALGETAPLLLIGMNAFITSAPSTPFDSATALPTQIFIWADSPERGFVSRTSAAILVLLTFLIAMNALAIFLRNKFERKW